MSSSRACAVLLAAAIAVGGCGGSDDTPAATTQTQATTSTVAKPANAEPKGKLSQPEYDSVRAAYVLLRPLEKTNDSAKAIKLLDRACAKVTTQTALLAAIHADCVQTRAFLAKARQFVTRKGECNRALAAGDVSCFAELFRSLGRSARVEVVRATQTNSILRRRGIRGRCAAALSTKKKELDVARAAVHHALGAAHALEARKQDAFERARTQLQADLVDDRGETPSKTLKQLKSCV